MTYSPEVLRRFDAPAHARLPAPGPGTLARGEAGSPEQSAWIIFAARIESGRLADVGYEVFGCPDTLAACSLAAERVAGAPIAALAAVDPLEIRDALGIPAAKTGRLLILQDALRNCLADWDNRRLPDSP